MLVIKHEIKTNLLLSLLIVALCKQMQNVSDAIQIDIELETSLKVLGKTKYWLHLYINDALQGFYA